MPGKIIQNFSMKIETRMSYGNKIISNLFMNETQAAINIYEFNILSDLHLFLHQMLIRVILETNYFYNLIV